MLLADICQEKHFGHFFSETGISEKNTSGQKYFYANCASQSTEPDSGKVHEHASAGNPDLETWPVLQN